MTGFAELDTQAGKMVVNADHVIGVQQTGTYTCLLVLSDGREVVLSMSYEKASKAIAEPRWRYLNYPVGRQ